MENVIKMNSDGKNGILIKCYGQGVDFGKMFWAGFFFPMIHMLRLHHTKCINLQKTNKPAL